VELLLAADQDEDGKNAADHHKTGEYFNPERTRTPNLLRRDRDESPELNDFAKPKRSQ